MWLDGYVHVVLGYDGIESEWVFGTEGTSAKAVPPAEPRKHVLTQNFGFCGCSSGARHSIRGHSSGGWRRVIEAR